MSDVVLHLSSDESAALVLLLEEVTYRQCRHIGERLSCARNEELDEGTRLEMWTDVGDAVAGICKVVTDDLVAFDDIRDRLSKPKSLQGNA